MEAATFGKVHSCPMCNESFHGNIAEFENHVQNHFLDEELEETASPFTTPSASSPSSDFSVTSIEPEFDIECDALGCNMKINIRDMAEHMDRHFAEQIQCQQSAEEQLNLDKPKQLNLLNLEKRERSFSPSISSVFDEDEAAFDLIGQSMDEQHLQKKARTYSSEKPQPTLQTTMDGFIINKSTSSTLTEKVKLTGQTTMDGFIKKPSEVGKSDSAKFTFMDPTPLSSEAIGIPGLIGKARLLLDISKSQGITKQAYLADPSVIYFRSDKSDRGWGCGYRNIQMMLSYVIGQTAVDQDEIRVTTQSALVPNPVPTITEIQQQIEFAWENGFDAPGAQQLDHKVTDTGKWIGTTEVWSVLSSLGIRCNILDFHTPTGPKGSHPAMLSAIYNYFRKPAWSPLEAPQKLSFQDYTQFDCDQKIIQTSKPPLYIQHQGHSRTVIGIEVLATGELNLLVFDPGRWLHKAIPTLKEESVSKIVTPSSGSKITTAQGLFDPQYLLKAFRVSPDWGLSKSQYQLLGISGLYNDSYDESRQNQKNRLDLFNKKASLSIGWNEEEAHQSKLVGSTRVP
ncbi:hypothetical protein BGZ46_009771 [Entomortierella lignicola]|nr:hypothetical protein BGZ46_009771 [Entomortierella lignicola]